MQKTDSIYLAVFGGSGGGGCDVTNNYAISCFLFGASVVLELQQRY